MGGEQGERFPDGTPPKDNAFNYYIELGKEKALQEIRQNFENSPDKRKNLPYHNTAHTQQVITDIETILGAIQKVDPKLITERKIKLGGLIAAGHDRIQDFKTVETTDGDFTIKKREKAAKNEENSAVKTVEFMREANKKAKKKIFSKQDMRLAEEATLVTVTDLDPELVIVQPNLSRTSSLVAKALALADLSNVGMHDPEEFMKTTFALFREENLDFLDSQHLKTRMIDWLKLQAKFAEGRQEDFKKQILWFPKKTQSAIRELFNRFGEAQYAIDKLSEDAKGMSLEELIGLFGYRAAS